MSSENFRKKLDELNKAGEALARMRVPKMVKNGFNSVLQTSAGSRRPVAARNSGTNAKSKTVSKSQKANKNHFTPF